MTRTAIAMGWMVAFTIAGLWATVELALSVNGYMDDHMDDHDDPSTEDDDATPPG